MPLGRIGSERKGSAALGRAREGSGCKKEKMFLQGKWVGVGSEEDQVAKNACFLMKMDRFRVLGGLGLQKTMILT